MQWLAYSIIAMILWGFWGLALKLAVRGSDHTTAYFLTSLASFSLALLIYLTSNPSRNSDPSPTGILFAILAGLTTSLGSLLVYKALEKGPTQLVIVISGLYPLITVLLSTLVLGEQLTPHRIAGIVMAVIAIIILSV